MTNYDTLTDQGKLRRLRKLAEAALEEYDLDVARLSFFGFATNLLFQVKTRTGARYMLRLASPGWRELKDLQSEAMWLEALHRETDIPSPRMLTTRSGSSVVPVSHPDVPVVWNASLMTWVKGRLLTHYLTPANLHKMGILFAKLHIHGGNWKPPAGFSDRVFDRVLSRGEPDLLLSEPVLAGYDDRQESVIRWLCDHVSQTYGQMDTDDLRVIHCDLWHANIKVHQGELAPFDFEDTVRGYRLHDLAMSMLDLLEEVGERAYPELLTSFRSGYTKRLPWPEGSLAALQAGRQLWMLNYLFRWHAEFSDRFLPRYISAFENYRNTGQIQPVG